MTVLICASCLSYYISDGNMYRFILVVVITVVFSDGSSFPAKSFAEPVEMGRPSETPRSTYTGYNQTQGAQFVGHPPRPAHMPQDNGAFRESTAVNLSSVTSRPQPDPVHLRDTVPVSTVRTGYVQPPVQSTAVQPAAVQPAVPGGEIPQSMEEMVVSMMFEECCPGMHYITATDLPDRLSFVLTYIEPTDNRFFWVMLCNDQVNQSPLFYHQL